MWSDQDDDNWTEEMKIRCNFEAKDDGVFFINLKDYLSYYYTTTICKYQTKFKYHQYSARETVETGQYGVFWFTVDKQNPTGDYNLSVHQLSHRYYAVGATKFEYAQMKVMVGKWTDNQIIFIEGAQTDDPRTSIELGNLTDGNYLVFVKPIWKPHHTFRTVVASIYANDVLELKRVYFKKFTKSIVKVMEGWLEERLALGSAFE